MAMTPEATKALVLEVLQRILRSWWTVVAAVCIGIGGASIALEYIPKVYKARCTIFIAPPKIAKMPLQVQDDIGMRLAALEEEVLSPRYLKPLIEELALEIPSYEAPQTERELDREMNRIRRGLRASVKPKARLFALAFENSDARVAAAVVNHLSDRFIEENITYRVNETSKQRGVYAKLADDDRKVLNERRREINRFRQRHINALQESFARNQQLLQARQRDLDLNQVNLDRARDGLLTLEAQAEVVTPGAPQVVLPTPSSVNDPSAQRLAQLQQELSQLKLSYFEGHPDVERKQRELDEFLATYKPAVAVVDPSDEEGESSAQLSPMQLQVAEARREIERLQTARTKIETDIATYRRWIAETPENQLQLDELRIGINDLEKKVLEYERAKRAAEDAEFLENERKGERFEVVERAEVPRAPVSPKPLMIYGFGVLAGLGLFVGPMVLHRILVPVIGSESSLREIADTPIVFSIPRIPTTESMRVDYWRRIRNVAFAGASFVVLGVALAFAKTDGKLIEYVTNLVQN